LTILAMALVNNEGKEKQFKKLQPWVSRQLKSLYLYSVVLSHDIETCHLYLHMVAIQLRQVTAYPSAKTDRCSVCESIVRHRIPRLYLLCGSRSIARR
jgi:hypothetical protein